MLDTHDALPLAVGYAGWKRVLDCVGAVGLLVVTLPVSLCVLVLLAITQGMPIWFCQRRVGRHGRPFTMWKFRTMTAGSHTRLPALPVASVRQDPRVTPVGHWLRRYGLDELPQFLNILRGEMSLVGPRPLPEDDLAHPGWLEQVDEAERVRRSAWFTRRHQVPPGLTGLWQISRQPEEDFENWIACDLAYVERCGFGLDLQILLQTPSALLRGRLHPSTTRDECGII